MYCKTIYKKDTSGKIRYLTVNTQDGKLQQISGVMNTDNPVVHEKLCEGKNIGKSNETTPKEQSELEAASIIKEKLRLGYFETIEDASLLGGNSFLLPMLAKDYKKEVKKVKFPCYAQPKLDGMRGLGNDEGIISRTGKPIETVGHIDLSFLENEIIDGEIYEHGESFQGIMRKVKKYREGETEKLQYYVYDMVSELPFIQRFLKLHYLVMNQENIKVVHTEKIMNEGELIKFHKQNIAEGYEGTMVRHSEEGYHVNKRSSQLLKYKDFLDESYEVIDVVPFDARPTQ
jgi:DNA ligase-1